MKPEDVAMAYGTHVQRYLNVGSKLNASTHSLVNTIAETINKIYLLDPVYAEDAVSTINEELNKFYNIVDEWIESVHVITGDFTDLSKAHVEEIRELRKMIEKAIQK